MLLKMTDYVSSMAAPARKASRVKNLTVRLKFLHDRGALFNVQDVLQDL